MIARIERRTFMPRANALKQVNGKQPARPVAGKLRAEVSDAELRARIEEAAYYRAQQRGFSPGFELDDWIAAESEVMRQIELQR
jgi:hypothetical protein